MIVRRIRGWFNRAQLRRDIDEEIRFHLEMRRAEYEVCGMSSREARRAATNRFGDVELIRRKVQRVRHVPTIHMTGAIDGMWQDLRFAFRGFIRQPAFAMFAILTLALGIGANTAIYSLVETVILNPLPFAEGDRLAWAWRQRGDNMMMTPTTEQRIAWRNAEQIEGMINFASSDVALRIDDGVESVNAAHVPPDLFGFLGISPVIGRALVTGDSAVGAPRVAMLAEGLWRSRYGADPQAVGRMISLDGQAHEVVGVVPSSLDALFRSGKRDVWMPLSMADTVRGLLTLVRIEEGTTFVSVQAELDAMPTSLEDAEQADWKPKIVPPHLMTSSQMRSGLWILLGSVGLILLIACANVANMLLARGVGRQHELAVRVALGAGRVRLARQLFVEALALSVVGATVGIGMAYAGVHVLRNAVPESLIELSYARLSAGVLAVAALLGVGSGLLFGLAPVLQGTSGRAAENLRQGVRGGDSARKSYFRQALVCLEVALAFVLFIGAGLLIRSFANLSSVDPGFDAERLVNVRIDLPGTRYESEAARMSFARNVLQRVRQLPQVAEATMAMAAPPRMAAFLGALEVEGLEDAFDSKAGVVSVNWVLPEYFETLGIDIIEGRGFQDDGEIHEVVLINDRFAHEAWPGVSAVGKRFRWKGEEDWMTVLGVVEDVKAFGLADDADRAQVYQPYGAERSFGGGSILVRAVGRPEDLVSLVRGQINTVDPLLPILQATTISHMYADSIARPRFNTILLGCFAALALLLAITGVYGVIAMTMNQRLREIGVRMALGASASDVKLLTLRWGIRPVLIGTFLGAGVSLALGRLLESQLFEVSAADPATYLTVLNVER